MQPSCSKQESMILIRHEKITPKTTVFSIIKKFIDQEEDFDQIYQELEDCYSIENLEAVLGKHIGESKGKRYAPEILKVMEKDNKREPEIQKLYKQLLLEKKSADDVFNLRNLVEKGKKIKFGKELIRLVGQDRGKDLYERYKSQILQLVTQPLPGAKQLPAQNGIDIYKHPENVVTERQRNQARTLLVLGQTGSGKSSFINSMINYLQGIELQDRFRYKLVVEQAETQLNSVTEKISTYFVKNKSQDKGEIYRIIDTPGFGDTHGIKKDNRTIFQLQKMIKNKQINQIHGVLFVMKSSVNRITQFQQYIFQRVMDLFGKDIAKNFVFVFTFYDLNEPLVLDTVKDKEKGFGNYWQLLQHPKSISVNNHCVYEPVDIQKKDAKGIEIFWDHNRKDLDSLFNKMESIKGNCLTMTVEMIRKKENLILRIKRSRELLKQSLKMHKSIIEEMQKIAQYSQEINSNKKFQYCHTAYITKTEPWETFVTKCRKCLTINCHKGCRRQPIKNCSSMDKEGKCTICDLKCSYTDHYRTKEIRTTRKIVIKETNETLKKKFDEATIHKQIAERCITNLSAKLDKVIADIMLKASEISSFENELNDICLTKIALDTTKDYLEYLVNLETGEKGKDANLMAYKNAIEECKILQEFRLGKLNQQYLKLLYQINDAKKKYIENLPRLSIQASETNKKQQTIILRQIPIDCFSESNKKVAKHILERLREEKMRRDNYIFENFPSFWKKVKEFMFRSK